MSATLPPRPGGAPFRQRALVGFVGLLILAAAGWLALIVVSRIDELFFPGQGLSSLPSLPGVDSGGESAHGRINILVMGLDRRPSEGDAPTRTDTMFVVTVNADAKTASIIGIPRDLFVEIPYKDGDGYYEDRVNTAYVTGESEGYTGGGAGLAQKVVERLLGIPIDHYVIIDFEGFIDLIDELGGVEVYVEEEVEDPTYSRTELPGDYTPLHFAVGLQHMDGQKALDYSRTRYDNSDLDRIRRQQQVIFAAIDKAVERRLLSTDSLVNLWGKYKGAIDTDVNDLRAPGYASLAALIDQTKISSVSIGAATAGWVTPDGRSVLLYDREKVQEIVQAVFGDAQLSEEAAHVEIQNAAGEDGLAADVVRYLEDFGFTSSALSAADGDGDIRPLTEIIDFTGKSYTVSRLASALDVAQTQVRSAGPGDSALATRTGTDVLVILGADAQARDFAPAASGDGTDSTPGPG